MCLLIHCDLYEGSSPTMSSEVVRKDTSPLKSPQVHERIKVGPLNLQAHPGGRFFSWQMSSLVWHLWFTRHNTYRCTVALDRRIRLGAEFAQY